MGNKGINDKLAAPLSKRNLIEEGLDSQQDFHLPGHGRGGETPMLQGNVVSRVAVVSAGVIGMTTALRLKQRGLSDTVLDSQGPGEGTSSGNAGLLATELIDPLPTPTMLRKAPRLWLEPMVLSPCPSATCRGCCPVWDALPPLHVPPK